MNDAQPEKDDFAKQRHAGIIAIAIAMPVALVLWLAIAYLPPPFADMDNLGERMLFTLKCYCLAVLFCLVMGAEAVAHERLSSPAFDPLSGFQTRRLEVNQRYLQNTVEQILVFAAALFGLAAYFQTDRDPRGLSNYCRLDSGALCILDRLSSERCYARSGCSRHGTGHDCPALCGRWVGFEIAGYVGTAVPVVTC